jgi:hypothetical protein
LAVTDSALKPKLVAAVRCDPEYDRLLKPPHGDPDYLDYLQYSTKSDMRSAFSKYVGNAGNGDCRRSAVWGEPSDFWDSNDKLACFKRGGARLIVWDDEDYRIVYRAGSKTKSYSELDTWWSADWKRKEPP